MSLFGRILIRIQELKVSIIYHEYQVRHIFLKSHKANPLKIGDELDDKLLKLRQRYEFSVTFRKICRHF